MRFQECVIVDCKKKSKFIVEEVIALCQEHFDLIITGKCEVITNYEDFKSQPKQS